MVYEVEEARPIKRARKVRTGTLRLETSGGVFEVEEAHPIKRARRVQGGTILMGTEGQVFEVEEVRPSKRAKKARSRTIILGREGEVFEVEEVRAGGRVKATPPSSGVFLDDITNGKVELRKGVGAGMVLGGKGVNPPAGEGIKVNVNTASGAVLRSLYPEPETGVFWVVPTNPKARTMKMRRKIL